MEGKRVLSCAGMHAVRGLLCGRLAVAKADWRRQNGPPTRLARFRRARFRLTRFRSPRIFRPFFAGLILVKRTTRQPFDRLQRLHQSTGKNIATNF